jgi:hypothetical protein
LSNKNKKIISKKGKAGVLYLTNAPRTGVIIPLKLNRITTKDIQSKNIERSEIFLFRKVNEKIRMINNARFSRADIITIKLFISKI